MVHLSKKEAEAVTKALEGWQAEDTLPPSEVERLKHTITVIAFNWHKLAKYCFWIAIVSIIISISSLIADVNIQKLLAIIFTAPAWLKCLGLAILSAGLYGLGYYWQRTKPDRIFSAEAILFLGVLATAATICQFGIAVSPSGEHFSILLLISFIIYGLLGIFFKSKLIWFFALISFGGWFGAETGYQSGWGAYYLGMNYPVRFVLFGGILTLVALNMDHIKRIQFLQNTTLIMGLLYLFIALWILSIFGDYQNMDDWHKAKPMELFHWSLLFAAVAIAAIYHGIKYENNITKGFGLTFIFINLYTRFFEYFWDKLHMGIFFALLAASFWYLGSKAEKIWHIEQVVNIKK